MTIKTYAAIFFAAAIALSFAAAAPADAQTPPKKSATKKVAAKKYGPVPISMDAPPRSRVTVRRSYLDAGTYVIPGDRKFTDYAIPPGYSPTSVIDNRGGVYIDQSPLPGPFTLPGRDNPYPWNWCVGC